MRHPFERVPRAVRRRLFLPLLAAALLVLLIWVITVAPMSNEVAPLSVSSFGTAWSLERARVMIASWDERAPERGLRHRVRLPQPGCLLDDVRDGVSVGRAVVPSGG